MQWKISGASAQGFRVYRDGQLVATLGAETREFRDSGLRPNTVYSYAVAAVGGAGELLSPPISDATRLPNETTRETRAAFDVVVVGATPGGIAAAISAARLGNKVALVSPSPWLGGMMAGGLTRTDFGSTKSSGGLFKEFADTVRAYYATTYGPDSPQLKASRDGYYFEPRVAKWVFGRMLAQEANISVMLDHHSRDVKKQGNRVSALYVIDLPRMIRKTLVAKVFIDATYEGDLAAQAGAAYRIGREGKGEFGEEHAGELFWDPVARRVQFGSGKGDRKVQAYNYRLILTRRADNLIPFPAPKFYDRSRYLTLLPDIASGRVKNLEQVMSILPLPEEKFDANNHPLGNPSTDLIGGSDSYPEADLWERERLAEAHRQHILGLLYFVQHDPDVPESFRQEARRWGFAGDEFVDNNHFPTQLYVREGRRIVGRAIFTEKDARSLVPERRPNFHPDSVAVADYPIDSHATSPEKNGLLEGFFYLPGTQTQPSQVPFGTMTPLGIEGVLVSVCVSSTHIGYGTLRMEPVFMSLGTAAGVAAHLAVKGNLAPSQLDVEALQRQLLKQRQVICVFQDVPLDHPHWAALQFFGTKGFFPEYEARPDAGITRAQALEWLWKWLQTQKPQLQPAIDDARAYSDLRPDHAAFIAAHSLRHWKILAASRELRPDEPLTAAQATEWLANAVKLLGRHPSFPAWPSTSGVSLTRAQWCQWLYDAQGTAQPTKGPSRSKN
ncbi:MAG: FAD-dependent oxidoreductase [Armatimonadetes bacterium]|nr:FAD-dependent oxidoreductase [Armatimonadota bacterium]